MASRGKGISRKRGTLPQNYRPGVLEAGKDHRRREIRWADARLQQHHNDGGGLDEMPVTLQSAAERAVFVEAQLVQMEAAVLKGESLDVAKYVSLATVLVKWFDRLGYTRKARRLQRLREYLADQSEHAGVPSSTPELGNGGFAHGHPEARAHDSAATEASSVPSPDGPAAADEVPSHE